VLIAFTAYSEAAHHLEARWLLMCHDRSDDDEIHMAHKFISIMLAGRRQRDGGAARPRRQASDHGIQDT
jgi:hypothetical protein